MTDAAPVAGARRAALPSGPLRAAAALFDGLDRRWESPAVQRRLGTALVLTFVASIGVIELNRLGLLPEGIGRGLSTNHLTAIYIAFSLLLLIEVVGLVFALARSVADSVGKQFELLSLILLRKAFQEISKFGEPIQWEQVQPRIGVIAADVGGALLIFVGLGFYYRAQRHIPITSDVDDQASFLAAKKTVCLALLGVLALLMGREAWRLAMEGGTESFFETFYTVLIFSDILLVLLALRYSSRFAVVFRNSGFAAATVLIRLALTAPEYYNALLGLGAVVFAIGLSLAYNSFAGDRLPRRIAARAATNDVQSGSSSGDGDRGG